MFLIDTNIFIYFLNGEEKVLDFFELNSDKKFLFSVISRMEVLIGRKKSNLTVEQLEKYFSLFEIISLNTTISDCVVECINENNISSLRKSHLQDLIIGATALKYKATLLTNNEKDFRCFKGLKIINPMTCW